MPREQTAWRGEVLPPSETEAVCADSLAECIPEGWYTALWKEIEANIGMCILYISSDFPMTLTNELVPNVVIIQNHEANHGELRQVDLKLKALVKDGVVPVLGHCPSAALCAVNWNTVYFHIHIGVHYISFGPRTPRLWQVLTAYYLGLYQ